MAQGAVPERAEYIRVIMAELNRIQSHFWSIGFLLLILAVLRRWAWLGPALRTPKVLGLFVLSATLLSVNWFVYIWAITNHRVLEASLGYFITPLANVLTGALVLRERLRPAQWGAVALAALGVGWMTWQLGRLPQQERPSSPSRCCCLRRAHGASR